MTIGYNPTRPSAPPGLSPAGRWGAQEVLIEKFSMIDEVLQATLQVGRARRTPPREGPATADPARPRRRSEVFYEKCHVATSWLHMVSTS